MMMPLPKQMQMRPIRHRRRRAHPHHHHPPTRARLVSSVPSSHARRLSVDRPLTRARLSSSSFIHSFPSSGRATCPTDRDGGAHTRVFWVSRVCPTDRPSIEPASGRSIARLGGRSRRVVSHSDESLLVVKAHPRRRDAATPPTRRIVRGPGGRRWVGSGSIRSDRRARVTRAWTGTSTRLARRDG